MFGVVLWSDTDDHKAVIWCEDHGDLAFYRQSGDGQGVVLDPGDWVQFDLTLDRHMRFANNPRLVAEGVFPELSETLGAVMPQPVSIAAQAQAQAQAQADRGSAEIIPFSLTGGAKRLTAAQRVQKSRA